MPTRVAPVITLFVGLLIGLLGGYLVNLQQSGSLQTKISELENQLESTLLEKNRLQDEMNKLKDQIKVYQEEVDNLKKTLENSQNIINQLKEEINRLYNSRVIVQNEKYLTKLAGSYNIYQGKKLYSTYFIPAGKVIKIVVRIWDELKWSVYFQGGLFVTLYYLDETHKLESFETGSGTLDFARGPHEAIFYVHLSKIPKELQGQVPLFMIVSVPRLPPHRDWTKNFVYFEVTVYDIFPP